MAVPQTRDDLLQYGIQVTPDGRLFLPFDKSAMYGMASPTDSGGFVRTGTTLDASGDNPFYKQYANEAELAQDMPLGSGPYGFLSYNSPSHQWGTTYDTSGLSPEQLAAQQFGGQYGYFLDPNRLGFTDQTVAGGQSTKPNESGAWQLASILAPAVGAVGSFGLDQIAASSVGTASSAAESALPAATSTAANAAADSGSATLSNTGGSMNYYTDPDTGDVIPISDSSYSDLGGGLSVDQYGNVQGGLFEGGPGTPGAGDFYSPGSDINFSDLVQKYGPSIAKQLYSYLAKGASGIAGGLGGLFGGGGSGPSLGSTLPGLLALGYAARQPGIDTSRLSSVYDAAGANAPLFTQAAIDPVQKNIAAGYGDLLQSQGLRGIRGSSFGNTDIANYMDTTNRTLGDVGATAAQKALGLQGDLASQIATLQAKSQELKNNLYGRAFDVLGRGLKPKWYGGLSLTP